MKGRNWFWGIFFLAAAVLLVASQVGSFVHIGFWSILATVLLVAIVIQSIVKRNIFGVVMPVAVLYIIYQKPLDLLYIAPWLLLLAALFASIGLGMLFRKKPPKPVWHEEVAQLPRAVGSTTQAGDDDNPYAKVSFSSASKYLHSTNLSSAQFIVSFGELDVFFDQVRLSPTGAKIYVDCSFGTLKLYVPREWHVVDHTYAMLGEVNARNRRADGEDLAQVLELTGNVQLGSVEVAYL